MYVYLQTPDQPQSGDLLALFIWVFASFSIFISYCWRSLACDRHPYRNLCKTWYASYEAVLFYKPRLFSYTGLLRNRPNRAEYRTEPNRPIWIYVDFYEFGWILHGFIRSCLILYNCYSILKHSYMFYNNFKLNNYFKAAICLILAWNTPPPPTHATPQARIKQIAALK